MGAPWARWRCRRYPFRRAFDIVTALVGVTPLPLFHIPQPQPEYEGRTRCFSMMEARDILRSAACASLLHRVGGVHRHAHFHVDAALVTQHFGGINQVDQEGIADWRYPAG
jgi:hypothetical protein